MDSRHEAPVACTLGPGDYKERLAWIADLARDGLLAIRRDDLRFELTYAPDVADRVRELMVREQACCGFLSFEFSETRDRVRLTISAPERARDVAEAMFEQFVPPDVRSTI